MNILVPVYDEASIRLAAALGAGVEMYMGFDTPEWTERFGPYEDINRMSAFRSGANITLETLPALAGLAKESGHDLFITLNAGIYSLEQKRWLQKILGTWREQAVTGVIIGDLCLASAVREAGLKVIASTMAGVYNAGMARFCQEAGVDRIILPRDLSLGEIGQIMRDVPEVEYECFLMRNGCRYSDAYCLARHSDRFGAICTFLDRSRTTLHMAEETFRQREKTAFNHETFTRIFHKDACGLCAVWDMLQAGVTACKIVGRADGIDAVLADASLALENIRIAENCSNREEYLERMVFPPRWASMCVRGLNCYYPEVRF